MARPFLPRFTFEPLLRASGCATKGEFARSVGVHRRAVYRYGQEGLTVAAAEHLCDRLGINPNEVWDEWAKYWADEEAS